MRDAFETGRYVYIRVLSHRWPNPAWDTVSTDLAFFHLVYALVTHQTRETIVLRSDLPRIPLIRSGSSLAWPSSCHRVSIRLKIMLLSPLFVASLPDLWGFRFGSSAAFEFCNPLLRFGACSQRRGINLPLPRAFNRTIFNIPPFRVWASSDSILEISVFTHRLFLLCLGVIARPWGVSAGGRLPRRSSVA